MAIRIYTGPGVCSFTPLLTVQISRIVGENATISTITAIEISQNTNWFKSTILLIIPGGRDLMYLQSLGIHGIANIKKYVANGGGYLGICAGATLACKYLDWEVGRVGYEVCGSRISLIDCHAIGSVTRKLFEYSSESGAEMIRIDTANYSFYGYVNGGCKFVTNSSKNCVLASYEYGGAAVISTNFGSGKVVITGVHLEVSEEYLRSMQNQIEGYSGMADDMIQTEDNRLHFLRELICEFGIRKESDLVASDDIFDEKDASVFEAKEFIIFPKKSVDVGNAAKRKRNCWDIFG